jgi:hypothetical protein
VQAAEWGAAGVADDGVADDGVADDGVADDGVADDGAACAAGVGTGPRSCARAGLVANRLNVATAPSTMAGRKKKCRGMI